MMESDVIVRWRQVLMNGTIRCDVNGSKVEAGIVM